VAPYEVDPFDVSFGGHPPRCSCDECAADFPNVEPAQDAHRGDDDAIDDDIEEHDEDLVPEDNPSRWWDGPSTQGAKTGSG